MSTVQPLKPKSRGVPVEYVGLGDAQSDVLPWARVAADTAKLVGEDAAFMGLEEIPG